MASARQKRRVLAADVGGTHTRLALYEASDPAESPRVRSRVRSAEHASLDALLLDFLREHGGPGLASACLAIAGPVIDGGVDVTNLPWRVEARALAALLETPRLRLLNDLQATAFGMLHLASDRFEVLQQGTRPRARGPVVVAAVGTGFGLAVLDWDGTQHHPRATESGHVGYAPRTEREALVLRRLQALHGRVSLEHVVSGPGLLAVYEVLHEASGRAEPGTLRERIRARGGSAAVLEAALAGQDAVCEAALRVFSESLAAAAGDAALAQLALGGVWLGGGMPPRALPALRRSGFVAAFRDKGHFAPLLESLPLEVCLEQDTALHGAARLALRAASGA